ncbi:hypothetical protein P0Y35_06595 [Kiritimatiellaeota bacterium B1221]|nr:hypothetical protein [Kiritimatiellaeota bacterium B1221]
MKKDKSLSRFLRPEITIVLILLMVAGLYLLRTRPSEKEVLIGFSDEVYEPMAAEKALRWLQARQHEDGF